MLLKTNKLGVCDPMETQLRRTIFFLIMALGAILPFTVIHAQQPGGPTCPAIVEEALAQMQSACEGVDRNNACYGNTFVEASFADDQVSFAAPRDRADLAQLESIRTAPLDNESGVWGISVLNIQANIPNTLPGQGVIMLLLGDTEVTNQVAAEDAFVSPDPVTLATVRETPIHATPSFQSEIIGEIASDVLIDVDVRSEPEGSDFGWVRVISTDVVGWVASADVLITEDDKAALTFLSSDLKTPMQAFTFSTGNGQAN